MTEETVLNYLSNGELIAEVKRLEEVVKNRDKEIEQLRECLVRKEASIMLPHEPLRMAERMVHSEHEMAEINGNITKPMRYTTRELKEIAEHLLVYVNNQGE